ncbi:MAG: hypothetical protein JWR76_227 [Mucilaginibacter sp.]|nr:hypothetical protein [Mucilaginibacter sp.]
MIPSLIKIKLLVILSFGYLFISKAQTALPITDSTKFLQQYSKAKNDYLAFEKKHAAYIQTKNIRMHYLSWGNPANRPLIWAHGSLLNGYELLPVADKLVKAGFYVIAIDYYGHGKTGYPDHDVSLYHIADDIKMLMDKLKIKKAYIGGFSRGGYIASAFYDAYPKNVLGLILEDGGSVASGTYNHQLTDDQLAIKAKPFDIKNHNPWDTTYNTELDAFRAMLDTSDKSSQFELFAIINQNKAGRWKIYEGLSQYFHMASSKQYMDLILRPTKIPLFAASMMMMEPRIIFRNLNVPVLILDPVSKDDPMPFEKENKALRDQHPQYIKYIVYFDTEHNIHYTHPQKFTADVIDFMKSSSK